MITSFRATGFRKFSSIQFDDIRNCNLIFGGIASGKTTLLEAIMTFFYAGNIPAIIHHLRRSSSASQSASHFFQDGSPERMITLEAKFRDGRSEQFSHFGRHAGKDFIWTHEGKEHHFSDELTTNQLFDCSTSLYTIQEKYDEMRYVDLYSYLDHLGMKDLLLSILKSADHVITDCKIEDGEVQLVNGKFMIPLRESGHGLQRLFQLVSGFVVNSGGVYCIDHIERSFHPLLLREFPIWLQQLADTFHVQLFITTHSYQFVEHCIERYPTLDQLCIFDVEQLHTIDGVLAQLQHRPGYHIF